MKIRSRVQITQLSRMAIFLVVLIVIAAATAAQEFANIEYLCAGWGPAVTWSVNTNEPPQFCDTAEEIYFLKQVSRFTRKKLLMPNPFTGIDTEDVGKGLSIYLCKMNPDGGEKTEIKELWHNVAYAIDTQAQSTWMEINVKTRRIVLSITYAGSDLTGLWVMNLDGSNLKRIYSHNFPASDVTRVNHPSWTPDGKWIVFDQQMRDQDLHQYRVMKCDAAGRNVTRLTDGIDDRQPSVSPDGKQIVYIHWINWGSLLWLADIDGNNQHALLDPKGKMIGGTFPTWSPDGKTILAVSAGIIHGATGTKINHRQPICEGKKYTYGWPQWGKSGIVGYTIAGILITDTELKEAKLVGPSHLAECGNTSEKCRW